MSFVKLNGDWQKKSAMTGGFVGANKVSAQIRFKKQYDGMDNWWGVLVAFVDSKLAVNKCKDSLLSVHKKSSRKNFSYGIYPSCDDCPYNVKKAFSHGELSFNEPINILYNRQARTVEFFSKTFEYTQTALPKNVDFAIWLSLWYPPQEVEVKIIDI